MTKKTRYLGWESGKSSMGWFGGTRGHLHEKGYGASAGDGKNSDPKIVGKIRTEYKNSRDR